MTGSEGRCTAVIGAGVIGLTTAVRLQEAGRSVCVFHDRALGSGVSAIAGAICVPYRAGDLDAREAELARIGVAKLAEVARESPASGVTIRAGRVVVRDAKPLDDWREILPSARVVTGKAGGPTVLDCQVPVVRMPVYLAWLARRYTAAGGVFKRATVRTPEELLDEHEDVVVCAGERGRDLCSDPDVQPVRGDLVVLRNSIGLTEWILDDDNPDGVCYVIAHDDVVIVGGSHEDPDARPTSSSYAAVLGRAVRAVPALGGLEIIRHVSGRRPVRRGGPRLGADPTNSRVLYNYGHGGSGVVQSWGSANEVRRLQARLLDKSCAR